MTAQAARSDDVDPLVALAAQPFGLWTRREAVAAIGRGRVDRLLAGGDWQSPWPGVLAVGGIELTLEQRCAAVLLAGGGIGPAPLAPATRRADAPTPLRRLPAAVLCGRTAARFYRLPLIDDADPCTGGDEARLDDVHTWAHQRHLVVPVPGAAPRELRRHQLTIGPGELRRTASGLWLLSPERTLFDCARLLTLEALVCAMDDALHRELCTREQLEQMAAAHLGDEGAPLFREALALADGRSESAGESLTRLLLLPALPSLVPQVKVVDERDRIVARLDLGDDEARFAVEFDGKEGHAGEAMVAKDRRRDRTTGRLGWWTERVTWFEVRRMPAATVRRIVEEHTRWAALTRLRTGR